MENQNQPIVLQAVPNSTAVLVLGILSIVGCFCYGLVGLILGIIALVLASRGKSVYLANPTLYSEYSLKNLNAGKVCAIIGTSLSGLYLVFVIIYLSIIGFAFGTLFSKMPWEVFSH